MFEPADRDKLPAELVGLLDDLFLLSEETFLRQDPPPEWIHQQLLTAMERARTDAALVYAFEQTGLIISDGDDSFSDEELRNWVMALEDYEQRERRSAHKSVFSKADVRLIVRALQESHPLLS